MKSACQKLPIKREPSSQEIEEMAKALCRKYPCLERFNNDENPPTEEKKSALSELGKSQLHVSDNLFYFKVSG